MVVSVVSYTSHLYLDWYHERDAHYSAKNMIFGHYNTKLGVSLKNRKLVKWSLGIFPVGFWAF